ncbi:cytochrome c5 family protein [soil metagenome]
MFKIFIFLATPFVLCLATHAYAAEPEMSKAAIEKRIKPVATVHIATPQPQATTNPANTTASVANNAQKIYQDHCKACHDTGLLGAPKLGVTSAWQLRAKQELKVLVAHVFNGYKAMPARGLCPQCTDAEIEATVKYMLQEAKIKS